MKTIGLIGGMSWRSSLLYYRYMNEEAARLLGGFHSAQSVMSSVDSQQVAELQHRGAWEEALAILVTAGRALEAAGSDIVLICSNTMHLLADEVAASISVPVLHSADVAADALRARGIAHVGFLGTRFTMEQPFYMERLKARGGLDVLVPGEAQRKEIHRVVYEELTLERATEASRTFYLEVIDELAARGAEAIVLGCTEMSLLLDRSHVDLPLLDTTELHAHAAVAHALR